MDRYFATVVETLAEAGAKAAKDILGANLSGGDEVILEKGSILTVLSCVDDEELLIKGPVHVKFETDRIVLLKERMPDSQFIESVEKYFEK